ARTHGPRGEQLAQLRLGGQPAGIELFMFDALLDLLDRHLGAVVHNRHAAEMLALRAPELPTWVVPLSAPAPAVAVSHESLGLPAGKLVIAHFGFVTRPKRPFLLLGAFARLRRVNPGVHLLFAGQDDTNGELTAEIERLDLAGDVTVTGYLAREEMDALISSVDIVVSLRFPHVGETSATLGAALAAGRPVAVQETGSWAELPESVVLRVAASGDEEAALAEALAGLVANPAQRAQLGQAARTYARETLGAEGYAVGIARAATAVSLGSRVPPARQLDERRSAVARFMAGGRDRLTTGTLIDAGWAGSGDPLPVHRTALAKIPPARSGGRLLDIGGGPALLRLLECVWGYQVVAGPADPREPLAQPAGAFDVVTCWDLPAGHHEGADLLAEINRVLAPGGVMVLATSSVGDLTLRRLLPEAGLSDDELTCVDGRGDPTTEPGPVVAVARKVGLPAAV
ncbi:MAG TPA: glycosyltransferase, partial [Actinomycetota bacterium]|nr:glycosyltransferase [Actinomycetota bacterium]